MKKLMIAVFLLGAIAGFSSSAWAQKADVSYWGGVVKYKTYEPWYYVLVQQDNKYRSSATKDKIASFFGVNTSHQALSQKLADLGAQNLQLAKQSLDAMTEAEQRDEIYDNYWLFGDILRNNNILGDFYTLKVSDGNLFYHLEPEYLKAAHNLFKTLIGSDPTAREQRPEPKKAWKTKKGLMWVQFDLKVGNEKDILLLCFDLKNYTLELFAYEAANKTDSDENLMDIKNWH